SLSRAARTRHPAAGRALSSVRTKRKGISISKTMMNECQGEQAEVRVLASANNWIEGTAEQQLKKTAGLPGMRLAVGLPDLHPGKGSPIGAAFAVEGWLYPALVGNDIGCGVGLWQTSLRASKIRREAWADKLRRLDEPWDGDAGAWPA